MTVVAAHPDDSRGDRRAVMAELLRKPEFAGVRRGTVDLVPLLPPLEGLWRGGLRRGSVLAVEGGTGCSALAVALLAGVSAAGGWCGVVGLPALGYVQAAELGVRLEAVVAVPEPGAAWAEVVAALMAGMDAVLVRPPGRVSGALARRLAARARQSRCTLVTLGPAWEGSDARVSVIRREWFGLGSGSGRLRRRRVTLATSGQPGPGRQVWLPDTDGGIGIVEPPALAAVR